MKRFTCFLPSLCTALAVLATAFPACAAFNPLPLDPSCFTHDLVVERSAPAPIAPATTASMDGGFSNVGYGWYERGYHLLWPGTGLPPAGAVISSDLAPDHQFQFPPDYRTNNALMVDTSSPVADLAFVTPASCAFLSFLFSGMHNGGTGALLGYRILHADGSAQEGSVVSTDWMDSGYSAFTTQGRVEVRQFTFSQVNRGLPKLFSADVTVTNRLSPVTAVRFSHVAGVRTAVFAISGSVEPGAEFAPLGVKGYNVDMVVEAAAPHPQWFGGFTTASVEGGLNNNLRTFYEAGYCSMAPLTGLPPAGTLLRSLSAPDHAYLLPASYASNNNAILLEMGSPAAELPLSIPAAAQALSFLTAAGNGRATNSCVVRHADGSVESATFVSPDWLDVSSPAAFSIGGCLDLNSRISAHPPGGPNLFGVDLSLTNATSPITNISVRLLNPASGTRTVILAVSAGVLERPVLSIRAGAPGALIIESSAPGTLESAPDPSTASSLWRDEGRISNSVTVLVGPGTRFWRVRR